MGTNYYMITDNKESRDRWLNAGEYEITDTPKWGYKIHVCKVSCGWVPIFESHQKIHSVELYGLMCFEDDFETFDEYGKKLTWNDFMQIIDYYKNKDLKKPLSGFTDHQGYSFMEIDFC